MSLLSRLREKQASRVATGTPATFATQAGDEGRTVASVATVIVAKSPKGQIPSQGKFGSGETATTSRWWRVYLSDSEPIEITSYPFPTNAEVSQWYPDATRIEPFELSAPVLLRGEIDIEKVLAWVDAVGEGDEGAIAEFINAVRVDHLAANWIIRELIRSSGEQP